MEDWDAAADLLKAAAALRRGPGRPYLLEGRMERDARVTGIPTRRWTNADRVHRLPAVFHHTWRAPDGTLALLAANWTDRPVTVRVADARLADATRLSVSTAVGITTGAAADTVTLPRHSAILLA
jgi:hypothetical protein